MQEIQTQTWVINQCHPSLATEHLNINKILSQIAQKAPPKYDPSLLYIPLTLSPKRLKSTKTHFLQQIMRSFRFLGKILHHFPASSLTKKTCLRKSFTKLISCFYRFLVDRLNPFSIQLCYFASLSLLGFFILKGLNPKADSYKPGGIDIWFMSVSSVTVSSMSTLEIEAFSNIQLVVMTILMFLGGEVFISMLGLRFVKSKLCNKVDVTGTDSSPRKVEDQIESASLENEGSSSLLKGSEVFLKYNSIRLLGYVVLGYLLVFLVGGSVLIIVYLSIVPSARHVLRKKGIQMGTFSVFTVVSTFTNCGFIPTNENMIAFKNNPGLLLFLIPIALFGNTLYPACLRFVIWLLGRLTRRDEFQYMLSNAKEFGYPHLLSSLQSLYLVITVLGFILVQFVLFCSMEWNSGALDGLSWYQKFVGGLFQTVSARHTGESIVDLSIISPAVLALFVFMMYLPPYTLFMPKKVNEKHHTILEKNKKNRKYIAENILFSHLTYLSIFVILICVTERKKLKDDPLNFTVFNIMFEVVSAYGNVGFSTGYNCKRQINPSSSSDCKDMWYGFSGRWSDQGKLVLIVVMFYGRLKKFNMGGGKAWKLM